MYTYTIDSPYEVRISGRVYDSSLSPWDQTALPTHEIELMEIDLFTVDFVELFTGKSHQTSKGQMQGFKPTGTAMVDSARRASQYFSILRHAFSDFNFGNIMKTIPSEKEVFHLNLKGNSNFRGDDGGWCRPSDDPSYIHSVKISLPFSEHPYPVYPDPVSGRAYGGSWTRDIYDYITSISSKNTYVYAGGPYAFRVVYRDPSWVMVDDAVVAISFTRIISTIRLSDGCAVWQGVYGCWFRPYIQFSPYSGSLGDYVPFSTVAFVGLERRTATYLDVQYPLCSGVLPPYTSRDADDYFFWEAQSYYGGTVSPYPSCELFAAKIPLSSIPDLGYITGNTNGFYHYVSDSSFLRFRDAAMQIYPSTFTGMAFSSEDAMSALWDGMSANSLETLREISDLAGLLSTYALYSKVRRIDFLKKIASIRGGKGRISFLLRALDLLADARLIYSFGFAPTIKDAEKLSSKSKSIIDKISNDSSRVNEYRGNFKLTIPEDVWGFKNPSYVENRSKIRVDIDPDSFLTVLFGLEAIGVLPTVSRLWELVPFSFVVDWFLGLGNNTNHIEKTAMLLGLNIQYGTHSVRIYTPWSSITSENMMLDTESLENDLGYQLYARAVLTTLPVPGPTKLPYFSGGTGLPSWETPTALLWKLIRF